MVCCFSLSAGETISPTPKDLSSYISFSPDFHKNKKTVFVKIKLLLQKARTAIAEYALPKIAEKETALPLPNDFKPRGSFFKYLDYKSVFKYLYPKHAFW